MSVKGEKCFPGRCVLQPLNIHSEFHTFAPPFVATGACWGVAGRESRLARRRYVEHAIPAQGCQRAAHCGRSASVLRVVLKKDVNGGNHTTAAEHSGQA